MRALLFSFFCVLCRPHILELKQLAMGVLQAECWVMDTNNLTAIAMGECQSSIYFINVGIGTPPQFFNLQLDTSREFPWLPASSGFEFNSSATCQISGQKTSTYVHRNLCVGQLGSDVVTVTETNISIRSSVAWTDQEMDLPVQIDGLMGMGYSNVPNFLDNAANENQIETPLFALEIRAIPDRSVLYYNHIPDEILKETHFIKNTGTSTWQVGLRNIKVGDEDFSYIAPSNLILDTSTEFLYFNNELYIRLLNKYFKNCHDSLCPCNGSYPDLIFVLDGIEVIVKSAHYLAIRKEGCFLLFGKTQYESSPLLAGTSLLRNYVVTFDKQNSRVGFNVPRLSSWPQVFVILQFSLAGLMAAAAGMGVWLLVKMKVPKKSKSKSKKSRIPSSISMAFMEPE